MDWPVKITSLLLLIDNIFLHIEGTLRHGNRSVIWGRSWHLEERVKRVAAAKAPACYIPFIADGLTYSECTMVGQTRGYWCATTSNYDVDGLWSWCNGPGTNSYAACYFPFLANGKLYTACIPDGTGSSWCAITANYDRDGKAIYCLNGVKLSTGTSISATVPSTGGLLSTTTLSIATATRTKVPSTKTLVPTVTTAHVLTQNASVQTLGRTTALTSVPITNVSEASSDLQNVATTVRAGGMTTSIPGLKASTISSSTVQSKAIERGQLDTTTLATDTATMDAAPSAETSVPAVTTAQNLPQNSPLETGILGSTIALTSVPNTNVPTASSDLQNTGTTVPVGGVTTSMPGTAPDMNMSQQPPNSPMTNPSGTLGTQSTTSTLQTPNFTSNITNSTDWEQLAQWLDLLSQNGSMDIGMDIIPELQKYTSSASPSGIHKDEVVLIVYILGNVAQTAVQSNMTFPISVVLDILNITNHLLNESSWSPASSSHNAIGPQLLESLERILSRMAMSKSSFNVSKENIDFYCLVAPCSNLTNQTALRLPHGSLALSAEDSKQDFGPSCLVNIFLLSYMQLSIGFPDNYDKDLGALGVDSNILTNVMLLGNESYSNPDVNLRFQCNSRDCDETATCAFWNFSTNSWSSDGCTTEVKDGVTSCVCQHLTSFSVLMAKFIPESLLNSPVLDYITITGLVISIASLLLCIAFQVYVMRVPMNLVAYYRHTAILNVSSFLLLSNISFIATGYIRPKEHIRLCAGLTFLTHFSLMAFFCWTLVQSIFLFCRLVFVFHHITKKEFMGLSIGLGYICPSVIAVWTFLYYTPTNDYNKVNVCWLSSDSGASMAFNIPTIVTISGNFLVLLVVIRKLLRPSISEGNSEDEEVIKKLLKAIVFCTPQFGLTWAVGIPLLSDGSVIALHYLFVLLNPLQGFFIFIFGCLLDKKVMDMVKKRIYKSSVFSSTATTVSSY